MEAIPIALLLLLGAALWPSYYTLLGLAALPAFVLAAIGIFYPRYFTASSRGVPRRWPLIYLHVMTLVACAALVDELLWVASIGR